MQTFKEWQKNIICGLMLGCILGILSCISSKTRAMARTSYIFLLQRIFHIWFLVESCTHILPSLKKPHFLQVSKKTNIGTFVPHLGVNVVRFGSWIRINKIYEVITFLARAHAIWPKNRKLSYGNSKNIILWRILDLNSATLIWARGTIFVHAKNMF